MNNFFVSMMIIFWFCYSCFCREFLFCTLPESGTRPRLTAWWRSLCHLLVGATASQLVYRDQFVVMPMPESVIKRLNELALADGRVKEKGNLGKRTVTFEQDGDARNGLPETMVTEVNNSVSYGHKSQSGTNILRDGSSDG